MRVVFAGTPEFAVPPLAALAHSAHRLVGVLTQPDRPAGRGQRLAASPVKEFAQRLGLPIAQPTTLRDPLARGDLERWAPDVLVVVAYGLLLPPEVLAIPRHGAINIHASLLPRWRGAAPVQRAIEEGDAVTGVTLMQLDAGLDTGPMLLQRSLPLAADDDSAAVLEALARLGAPALLEVLSAIEAGTLQPAPQPTVGVTYARKISKSEAPINWQASAAEIDRRIRAFRPWPIAETTHRGEQVRVHRARPLDPSELDPATAQRLAAASAAPGSLLGLHRGLLVVRCGRGLLGIAELQRAGRRSVSGAEFARSLATAQEMFADSGAST